MTRYHKDMNRRCLLKEAVNDPTEFHRISGSLNDFLKSRFPDGRHFFKATNKKDFCTLLYILSFAKDAIQTPMTSSEANYILLERSLALKGFCFRNYALGFEGKPSCYDETAVMTLRGLLDEMDSDPEFRKEDADFIEKACRKLGEEEAKHMAKPNRCFIEIHSEEDFRMLLEFCQQHELNSESVSITKFPAHSIVLVVSQNHIGWIGLMMRSYEARNGAHVYQGFEEFTRSYIYSRIVEKKSPIRYQDGVLLFEHRPGEEMIAFGRPEI